MASGNHGMKPMPAALAGVEHVLGVAVDEVVAVLDGDDLDDARARARAPRRDTFETPMWRILPSSWSSLSAPTESSSGTFGSGACSW